jgi:dTDP-4-amino-4,6-dideoxygalactose transaminase
MDIQMVDLLGQYQKIKEEIDQAISDVIQSSVFVKGGKVLEFEENLKQFVGVNHIISCGNGTDALQIAIMALGLEEGDEVITTPLTFVSTLEVLALMKLKPVLVDVDSETFNIRVEAINSVITSKTKAIVPVHLFGQCANMENLLKIAKQNNLFLIEDACQALGTEYIFGNGRKAMAGTIGEIGFNSFFPTKNLGAYGDGGAIYTNRSDLAEKMRSIANHGMSKKYHYKQIGMNSRLDALQAAILDVKLKYINQYIAARQTAADYYDQKLKNIPQIILPKRTTNSTHTFHQYTIKVPEKRDQLQQFLQNKGIPSMVYYPMPLHLQEAYHYLGYKKGDFPVAEELSQLVLSLPMHTELTNEQLESIVLSIHLFFE